MVLEALNKNKLQLNMRKCEFASIEVKFFGFIIGERGLKMNPDKIKALQIWLVPTSITELWSFMGLASFY